MEFGVITQARMTSTRLPGKVLLKADEVTFLEHQIRRLKGYPWSIIVATTINETDDCIEEICKTLNVQCFRGSESNVLERYAQAAKYFGLSHVCRVTSDCPLIDSKLILRGLELYMNEVRQSGNCVYLSNTVERTFPRGFDFEWFSVDMLNLANLHNTKEYEREHVTPFFYKSHREKFRFLQILNKDDKSGYRITLDESDDLKLLKVLIEEYDADKMGMEAIVQLMDLHPELVQINAHVEQKKI
ncbi:cytidylyltransferase domain-containing protein [Bdellovibrio sp. HCB2-146]|uniref:cytidylyltransferase domain-containing protein n=1 Tax=Bdellovibrio sp. HCB2-146 TaxID=3394362 RepID=UPI0039BD5457